jgi:hypothetical protein
VSSCTCKRWRCIHKLYECPNYLYVKFVGALAPFTHAWTPEKTRLILIQNRFIELWTNQNQTGDSTIVQSKGMTTIYINSIRTILPWPSNHMQDSQIYWPIGKQLLAITQVLIPEDVISSSLKKRSMTWPHTGMSFDVCVSQRGGGGWVEVVGKKQLILITLHNSLINGSFEKKILNRIFIISTNCLV